MDDYYLSSNQLQCKVECIYEESYVDGQNKCKNTQIAHCATCNNDGSLCTSCKDNKFLKYDGLECVDVCGIGYCNEITTYKCVDV